MEQDSLAAHNDVPESFRDQLIRLVKENIQAFAANTPGYDADKRSRWAYAFNPLLDGDPEKPVYASMAALRAPNFAALRVGVTVGSGQVVIEVEYRKLVVPYITDRIENPREFPKILNGLRQIIQHFERVAGIQRNVLYNYIADDSEFRVFAKQSLAEAARESKRTEIAMPDRGGAVTHIQGPACSPA